MSRPLVLYADTKLPVNVPGDTAYGEISGAEDEDQVAVARLYRLLWEYCEQCGQGMQIIVTDHVELLEDWFRASIVERWRDGIKLVHHHGSARIDGVLNVTNFCLV